jgi:hypothetical protein
MSDLAAILLAHDNPAQVRRLIAALAGVELFLHCDVRTPQPVFAQMLEGAPPDLRALPRRRADLFSWSLLEAELLALRAVLEQSRAEHIIVLSGSCYPLVSIEELREELARWRGHTRLELKPLPYPPWSTPRNDDGGLWRVRRRFLTLRDRVVYLGPVPLRTSRVEPPRELRLHGGAHWKIYARAHASALLRVLGERPDLAAFWRHTLLPEESAVHSILASPELVGEIAETMIDDPVWYLDWAPPSRGRPAVHPRWLGRDEFDALVAARFAPPRPVGEPGDGYRKLFARKLSPDAPELAELIDELRRV